RQALAALQALHRGLQRRHEVVPAALLAALAHGGRAVGVVEREDLGLRRGAGGAAAGRVVGVALELGGPALVALGQHAFGEAAVGHGRRVEERLAGRDLGRGPDVGDDLLLGQRRPGAGREAGQREAGPEQLEEVAAVEAALQRRGLARELLLEELLELLGLGELAQGPPVRGALLGGELLAQPREVAAVLAALVHRWHGEHWMSLSVSMW